MANRTVRVARIVAAACLFQIAATTPAQASSRFTLRTGMAALLQVGSNICFTYTYDKNGNRTALTNLTYGPTAVWGSSKFGCFNWGS